MRGLHFVVLITVNVALMPLLEAKVEPIDAKGIIVPVYTPLDKNDKVKTDNIRQYAQYLKDKKADGVLIAATTGGGPSLTVKDKKKLIDAWVDACDPLGLYVTVEVGAIPLPDAQELASYAEKAGIRTVFVQPENYYKARNTKELVYYLQLIAKSAANTAIVFDDIPEFTEVDVMDIEDLLNQATEKISNFKGIKTTVFSNALKIQNKIKKDQRIFISNELYLEAAVLMGFDNFIVITSNTFPKLVSDIVKNGQRGNVKKSKAQYRRLIDLYDIITEQGNTYAALKEATILVTGIELGDILPPQNPLTDDQESSLIVRLRENNVEIVDYDYTD